MYERGMVAVWAADSTQHHTNELHHMCICMCVAFISAYHFQTNYKLFSTTPIRQMAISRAQYINTGGANQWVCTLRMYEMYYVCLLTRANVQTHWYDSVICSWTLLTSWISGNRPYQLARRDKHMPSTQSQQFSHCVCVRARAICMFGDCFNQSGSDWQFQHSNRMRIGARTVASGVCCYVKHTCGAYELTHFVQSSGAWVESIRLEEQKKKRTFNGVIWSFNFSHFRPHEARNWHFLFHIFIQLVDEAHASSVKQKSWTSIQRCNTSQKPFNIEIAIIHIFCIYYHIRNKLFAR